MPEQLNIPDATGVNADGKKPDAVIEEDFSQMEEEELRRFSGILRRDYRQGMEEQKKDKNRLELLLNAYIKMAWIVLVL